MAPALAMGEVSGRLGAEMVTVVLDFHELVMRMGFGDMEAVKVLKTAGIVVHNAPGLRAALVLVDDEGYQYLRVGSDGSGWFSRLQENGTIEVTRNGERRRYTTVLRQEKSARINQLMNDKYGWGDDFIALLVGSREGSIPVELHPID